MSVIQGIFRQVRAPVLSVTGFLLLIAILVQIVERPVKTQGTWRFNSAILPASLSGWTVRNEELGPTEMETASAMKVLENPAYTFRSYRRGDVWFSVYVAYWNQRSDVVPLVLDHTPEHCWSSAGMRCVSFENKAILSVGEFNLPPVEARDFTNPDGSKLFVIYWLYHGQRLYDWGNGLHGYYQPDLAPLYADLLLGVKRVILNAFEGKRDQCFVRIAANVPFGELSHNPGFASIVASLSSGGLCGEVIGANPSN